MAGKAALLALRYMLDLLRGGRGSLTSSVPRPTEIDSIGQAPAVCADLVIICRVTRSSALRVTTTERDLIQ